MAKRKSAAVETIEPPAQEAAPPSAAAPATERVPAEHERPRLPDVSEQKTVLISPEPDGAKVRLLRSRRYNQVQISPDGELPDWARERLKDAGWRDRVEDEGIYTKQLPPRAKPAADGQEPEPAKPAWPAVIEAERFFEQLANDIRAERGMPPIRLGTAAGPER
jgi:hypothetical protein